MKWPADVRGMFWAKATEAKAKAATAAKVVRILKIEGSGLVNKPKEGITSGIVEKGREKRRTRY
jgi:hypothetical protein